MTVRMQSVRLDEIIAIKWRCPKCGAAVEIPVQRKADNGNGHRLALQSCPSCMARFLPGDPESVAAFAWQGLDELIQRLRKYGQTFTLVVPSD